MTRSDAPTQLYIDGRWVDATGGALFPVHDPATEEVLAHVSDATIDDGVRALDAAVRAQSAWGRTTVRERADILRRAYEMTLARIDEFATLMTLEMGKPLAESRAEVVYGAEFLRWFSELAPQVAGRYLPAPTGSNRILTVKRPVGPALLITPWNFPLAMATRKIGPAVAAGCTMVLKPAELTPLTALLFTQVMEEAGLPAGVLNVIPTTRPGEVTGPMIKDRRLRKLSFTGSTPVGKLLIAQSADTVLRVSMELGGNAPFLVFADADLEAAVAGAVVAKMRNGGESCVAANRFIVHRSVADEFAARLAAALGAIEMGPGLRDGVGLGALIDDRAVAKVTRLVDAAVAGGATVLTGGAAPDGTGFFYPPTVLGQVPADSGILREEIFGPVAPIVTFDTDAEAMALANDTDFGLVAYVFTRDINRALSLGERIEAGMIGVNTGLVSNPAAPFGGIKQSGLGREGSVEGIEEYLETVYLGIHLTDPGAE